MLFSSSVSTDAPSCSNILSMDRFAARIVALRMIYDAGTLIDVFLVRYVMIEAANWKSIPRRVLATDGSNSNCFFLMFDIK